MSSDENLFCLLGGLGGGFACFGLCLKVEGWSGGVICIGPWVHWCMLVMLLPVED